MLRLGKLINGGRAVTGRGVRRPETTESRVCGITGWVSFGHDLRAERPNLEAMTETMACRGPDDRGIWVSHTPRSATAGWRSSTCPAGGSR